MGKEKYIVFPKINMFWKRLEKVIPSNNRNSGCMFNCIGSCFTLPTFQPKKRNIQPFSKKWVVQGMTFIYTDVG